MTHPTPNDAAATSMDTRMPAVKPIRWATSVPSSATPIAPPIWRPVLITPEASPARPSGADSITAAVAAGIVSDIPSPAAISGTTSAAYGVCWPAATKPSSPAAPRASPVTIGVLGPVRAMIRPDRIEPTDAIAPSGSSASPVTSAE